MNKSAEIRRALEEVGFDEVYLVSNFKCYRGTKEGPQEVLVEILDLGSGIDRYRCRAKTENGKSAFGDAHSYIHGAITSVHWQDLD